MERKACIEWWILFLLISRENYDRFFYGYIGLSKRNIIRDNNNLRLFKNGSRNERKLNHYWKRVSWQGICWCLEKVSSHRRILRSWHPPRESDRSVHSYPKIYCILKHVFGELNHQIDSRWRPQVPESCNVGFWSSHTIWDSCTEELQIREILP